jgi:uncharacterized membrane protein
MNLIVLSLFYLLAPYGILLLTKKYKILNRIGAVLLCYALGFVLGLTDILPDGSAAVQDIITSGTVPLALPLLLFGTKLSKLKNLAGKTFLSMFLAIIALISLVTAAFLLFGKDMENSNQIAGLLVGLYTGGTPNLASIQAALGISPEIYLMVNTYDIMLSSIFLLIILSTGGKFLNWLLPKYKSMAAKNGESENEYAYQLNYNDENPDPYSGFFKKQYFKPFIIAFLAAILIAGISVGLSFLITGSISMLVVILSITSLSLGGSFIPKLNKTEKSFEGGMYLILVFSLAVASMVKLEDFLNISPTLFWFVSIVIFGSFILHILFSAILKVDSDTTLVTATAMICSPPFVPVVAGALKNKEIILPGLTVGIIGYAIGNYLGVLIAYGLDSLLGIV